MGIVDKFISFLEKLGEVTIEVSEKPIRRVSPEKTIQERLELLKKLQEEVAKEKPEEEEIEILTEWRSKEIQKFFLDRVTDATLRYFKGPIKSMTQSIKGLEYDLYRANIMMSKEKFVALMLGVSIIMAIFAFLFALLLAFPPDISLMVSVLGFIFGFLYMRNYPKMVYHARVTEVERALPFVLRHMASLLGSGVGIAETLLSVANSEYGVISEEFKLLIRDMHSGASFEEALTRFEEKMKSENVSRVIKQILRAVKFGGNLVEILYKLADDYSFEYRMKLVDYVQKVNGLAFVYMFISVVLPTMLIVAILAASAMTKRLVIPVQGLAIILLFGFPLMSLLMIIIIKRNEPR